MLIPLHGTYSGKTIVEAFQRAAGFQDGGVLWRPEEVIGDYQYDLVPARPSVRSLGVLVRSCSSWKKYLLFGERVWRPNHRTLFTLRPLVLTQHYSTIDLEIEHVYEVDQGGHSSIASDPGHPEFNEIRPSFERMLNDFAARLTARN